MEYFLRLLFVLTFACVCGKAANENENAAAFHTLCSIYRLALGATDEKFTVTTDQLATNQAETEVGRLYTVTASDEYFEFGQSPLPKGITSEEKERKKKEWDADKKAWIDEKLSGAPAETRKKYERLQPGTARGRANKKIDRIRTRLAVVKEELGRIVKRASEALNESRRVAKDAIYGKDQEKVDATNQNTFSDNYANSCGNGVTGSGGPGKSLINDMVCLCIGGTGGSATKLRCGRGWIGSTLDSHQFSNPTTGDSAWGVLQAGCAEGDERKKPTARSIEASLAAFKTQVGAQAESSAATEFVLGKPNAAGCDGNTNAADKVCVNYKQQLTGKKGDFTGIKWFKAMEDLAEKEDELRKLEQQAALQQLRSEELEARAWEAYHEAYEAERLPDATIQKTIPTSNASSSAREGEPNQIDQQSPIRSNERFTTAVKPISGLLASRLLL